MQSLASFFKVLFHVFTICLSFNDSSTLVNIVQEFLRSSNTHKHYEKCNQLLKCINHQKVVVTIYNLNLSHMFMNYRRQEHVGTC